VEFFDPAKGDSAMAALKMVEKFFGDPVQNAEAELKVLVNERAEVIATIERAQAAETEADDPDQVLRALAERKAATNRSARLEVRINAAVERLENAKSIERQRLRAELLATLKSCRKNLSASASKMISANRAYLGAKESLLANGFSREFELVPSLPHINGNPVLTPDGTQRLESAFDAAMIALGEMRAPMPPASLPIPSNHKPEPVAVREPVSVPIPPQPRPRDLKRETATGDNVLFTACKSFEHPDRGRIAAGDEIAVLPNEAASLIRGRLGDVSNPEDIKRVRAAAGLAKKGDIK
jgi:hypothetical protein